MPPLVRESGNERVPAIVHAGRRSPDAEHYHDRNHGHHHGHLANNSPGLCVQRVFCFFLRDRFSGGLPGYHGPLGSLHLYVARRAQPCRLRSR